MNSIQQLITNKRQNWTHDDINNNATLDLEINRKQLMDIERRLEIFSSPKMEIKLSTYPRNKLNLHCQPLSSSFISTKKFSATYPGKTISTQCSFGRVAEIQSDKIDVETEIEELSQHMSMNKQCQTDPILNHNHILINNENVYLRNEIDQVNDRFNSENCVSARFVQQGTILTQNEVDRIASDGEHLFYYSETSKSLCYITDLLSTKQANGTSITKEISCRWPARRCSRIHAVPRLFARTWPVVTERLWRA